MTPQTKLFADWFNAKQNRAADSMTVQEWLSTPWHYNSLPLEKHAVMFTDGECYSEGCRRAVAARSSSTSYGMPGRD